MPLNFDNCDVRLHVMPFWMAYRLIFLLWTNMYICFLRGVRECEYYMSTRLSGDTWSYVPLTQMTKIMITHSGKPNCCRWSIFDIFIYTMLTFQDLRKEEILSSCVWLLFMVNLLKICHTLKKYVRSEVFQLHYVFFQFILFLITYLYLFWVIYNIFAN